MKGTDSMLSEYQKLIYEDEKVKEKVKNDCLNEVLNIYKNRTKDEVIKAIASDKPNDINSDYEFALLMTEGQMLFDKAVKNFGEKLWNGGAWQKENCKEKCPFGSMCKKDMVVIDKNRYCYGQIYQKKICEKDLLEMVTNNHTINIVNANDHVYLDLNDSNHDKQLLSEYFLGTIGLFGGLEIMMADQMTKSMVIILYLFYHTKVRSFQISIFIYTGFM